jgi:RNA polymerase sigma factor (sigma-70 family)
MMVLRLCKRVLHNEQDAEDAFQATFLVLSAKARSLRPHESLAGWLHTVAYRVAQKARVAAARRRTHEGRAKERRAEDPLAEVTLREAHQILDRELAGLPDKLRAPLVLCYLEGLTRDEAAKQLSCPPGTLKSRLEQARERLQRRLVSRGLAFSGTLVASLFHEPSAEAGVPSVLLNSTVKAASLLAAGQMTAAAAISAHAASLARGVLRTMWLSKLGIGAFLILTIGLGGTVAVLAAQGTLAAQRGAGPTVPLTQTVSESKTEEPKREAKQAQDGPGRLLFYRQGHLTLIGPDGKDEKRASEDRDKFMPGNAWLSPDGKKIAFLVQVERKEAVGRDPRRKVYVRGLDDPEPGDDLGVEAQQLTWSPDGTELAVVDYVHGDDLKDLKFVNWVVNVKTKEKKALKLPDNHSVCDWSRDGKYFLTTALDLKKDPAAARLYLMNRDGTEAQALTDAKEPAYIGRLSPDGRKVLYLAPDPERKDRDVGAKLGLFVLDIKKGTPVRVEQQPLNGELMGFCWSPDGKRIAYSWREVHAKGDPVKETQSSLVVADADGKNPVTIATEKGDSEGVITIGAIDWR